MGPCCGRLKVGWGEGFVVLNYIKTKCMLNAVTKFVLYLLATAYVIRGREMSGQSRTDHACPNHFYTKINMHARKLGHLSAVYCVSFDRTGHYIFTVSYSS